MNIGTGSAATAMIKSAEILMEAVPISSILSRVEQSGRYVGVHPSNRNSPLNLNILNDE
jgi:hypothetical protein